jgi:hypothetical protein
VRPYLEKLLTKIGLVEWLKVKALSSNPSTIYTQKKVIWRYKVIEKRPLPPPPKKQKPQPAEDVVLL